MNVFLEFCVLCCLNLKFLESPTAHLRDSEDPRFEIKYRAAALMLASEEKLGSKIIKNEHTLNQSKKYLIMAFVEI